MEYTIILKALADETRMNIIRLLLKHNHCVRALARKLNISEAAVSQHLKVLREAGLLKGEKHGYFMHYDVNRDVLHQLASSIETLACLEREVCTPKNGGCQKGEYKNCHNATNNVHSVKDLEHCHGKKHSPHGTECRYGHDTED